MHLPSFCLYVQLVPISLWFHLIRFEMLRVPQLGKPGSKEATTKREKIIKKHHLSHSISLLQLLDEPLALFIKSPPQSQSRGPRKFKFRSPMYHSYITGFNFHCGLTEGQIKVVQLSYTNQNHEGSKDSQLIGHLAWWDKAHVESHCSLTLSARNTHASPTFLVCNDGFVKKVDEQGTTGKKIFFCPVFPLFFKHSLRKD